MSEHGWHARVFDGRDGGSGGGSGFLVDNRHVLTCAHVVDALATPMVSLPAVPGLGDLPARTVYRGPYDPHRAGVWKDDVAVLELPAPVAVRPAEFAPLRTLDRAGGEGLRAYGFPEHYGVSGVNADLVAVPRPRVNGQACQLKAAPGFGSWLAPGFSGAAVFLQRGGEVVGMVTQSDTDPDSRQGLMLPTDVLTGHWSVADLVTLGPFSAEAYRELVALLTDLDVSPRELYGSVMSRHLGAENPGNLSTVQDVAEFLATGSLGGHKHRGYVGDLIYDLLPRVDEALQARLTDWVQRYVWNQGSGITRPPYRTPSDVASVIVRIRRSGSGDQSHLTFWLLDGQTTTGTRVEKLVPVAKERQAVEEEIGPLTERVPITRTVMVEFVLPPLRLSDPVETWRVAPDAKTQLGWRHAVVVRDFDRFHEEPAKRAYRLRAGRLRASRPAAAPLHWARCQDLRDPSRFAAWLEETEDRAAVALATGPERHEPVEQALKAGVPVLLWSRKKAQDHDDDSDGTNCAGLPFRQAIANGLGEAIDTLPMRIRELRSQAGQLPHDAEHCGRGVTLLWDDPDRRPVEPPLGLSD